MNGFSDPVIIDISIALERRLSLRRLKMPLFANDRSVRLFGNSLAFIGSLWCMPGMAAESPQVYPSKPVRVIVPQAGGGAFDAFIQLITQKIRESWGATLVMVNQPGGN